MTVPRSTSRRVVLTALVASVLAPVLGGAAPAGAADPFAPVRLAITAPSTARLDRSFVVRVAVEADAGALDYPDGPLLVRAKLAPECGGDFAGTKGPTLVDAPLPVQPTPGQALSTAVSGRGRAAAYGVQSVCVFVESSADARQYVTDVETAVDVSRTCTVAARRLDGARTATKRSKRALGSARTALRRARSGDAEVVARRTVSRRRRTAIRRQRAVAADTALARKACGPGVDL